MKKHHYHPDSWSKQARRMCDRIIDYINNGYWCIEQAHRYFLVSSINPIIVSRARVRFGRKMREGKIHETTESITNYEKYKKRWNIIAEEQLIYHGHPCKW